MITAKAILGKSIDFAKPLKFSLKNRASLSYIRTQQWSTEVAWSAFMSLAMKIIPDDLYDYDWLDFELEEIESDNYTI